MKTNQTTALGSNATSQTSQLMIGDIIPPVLLDCMMQLKDVNCKLRKFCTASKELGGDRERFMIIDTDINSVVSNISDLMRDEMLLNLFHKNNDYE